MSSHAEFERVYDRYVSLVFGIARRMSSDALVAENVTQAIFEKYWTMRTKIPAASVARWLSREARTESLSHARQTEVRELPDMFDAVNAAGFEHRDMSVPMAVAMGRLQMGERDAIEIGFFKGWSAEEIALDLGVSPLVVKRNIRSGLARLRDLLSGLSVRD